MLFQNFPPFLRWNRLQEPPVINARQVFFRGIFFGVSKVIITKWTDVKTGEIVTHEPESESSEVDRSDAFTVAVMPSDIFLCFRLQCRIFFRLFEWSRSRCCGRGRVSCCWCVVPMPSAQPPVEGKVQKDCLRGKTYSLTHANRILFEPFGLILWLKLSYWGLIDIRLHVQYSSMMHVYCDLAMFQPSLKASSANF